MEHLRVGLCQIDAVVGDLPGNRDRILEALAQAEALGAELAVFPELAVCGYPPEDLLASSAFVQACETTLEEIARATGHCAAVVGFVEASTENRPARPGIPTARLHNSAAILQVGAISGVWRKELLPNYGVFDERRFFASGDGLTPMFVVGGVRVALSICEDAWYEDGPVVRQGRAGAELIVSLNASPYRLGATEERSEMLCERSRQADAPIVYVNLVGVQDELVFDGASMVVDRTGQVLARLSQFKEEVAVLDVPVEKKLPPAVSGPGGKDVVLIGSHPSDRVALPMVPVVARPSEEEEVYGALVCAVRGYTAKNRFQDVVIGLSGGIDSSLVAAIATDALGPARVHGVAMPSRFSSSGSLEDAERIAKNLGIDFRTIEIESVHGAYLELLEPSFQGRDPDLAEENLQARIRGTMLMALSNKFGWLVLTTGNKSETAVGYSTMYGDSAGGYAVIKDVPKTLVYGLSRFRNQLAGIDVIPNSVLEKPPTAELRANQLDSDSLPPYEVLDPILAGYVEKNLPASALTSPDADLDLVRRIIDLVDHAEYKRRQSPPGPRITTRGFGKDRRMPITNKFRSNLMVGSSFDANLRLDPAGADETIAPKK